MTKAFAAAALVMALAVGYALRPESARGASRSNKANSYNSIQTQIKALRGKVKAAKQEEHDLLAELKSIDQGLEQATRELDQAMLKLQRARAQEMRIQGELEDAHARYQESRDAVADRLVTYYKSGRAGYVEVVLKSSSMEDFISRAHYVRTLLKNNRVMAMNLRKERDSIKAYHDDLSEARQKIEKMAESMRQRQEEIAMEKAKRDYMLTRIMGEKQYYERSLDEMEKQSQEFTRYIRAEQLSVYVPGEFSGRLMWPFHGRITSPFGHRWGRAHTGLDIDCRTGDPLVAADSGIVILSGWKNGYGNTVIIQHAGNISTLYGHGSRNIATKGARVRRGEVVQLCGSTGRSTGDHLHFEVRVNGVPQNPMGYLR
jgi:murein DD-endopeptidase MepM/ murein hydrolase activator NlpD